MITAYGVTHPGHVRQINEDSFLCDPELGLFIVSDGMGGHQAGEVASRLAVEAIRSFVARTRDGEEVTWPYGINPSLSFGGNRIMTAIKLANRRVFKAGESREEYLGMGTTVVVGLIENGRILIGNVGDSRAYSFTSGTLAQLTEDESWVAQMLASGNADPTTIAKHPMKHVLTNVIGARDHIDCRIVERTLDADETFLFSTDGLHGVLDDTVLTNLLRGDESAEILADRLVQKALDEKADDNITAVVIRYRQ